MTKDSENSSKNSKRHLILSRISQIMQFYYISVPMIFAIILLWSIHSFEQIPGLKFPLSDPGFKIGLYLVIMASIIGIAMQFSTELRFKKIEKDIIYIKNNLLASKNEKIQKTLIQKEDTDFTHNLKRKTAFKKILRILIIFGIIVLSTISIGLIIETVFVDVPYSDLYLSQLVNPKYYFVSPIILENDALIIPAIQLFSNGTSVKIEIPLKTFTNIVFETTALSAQNSIMVHAKIFIHSPNPNITLEEKYYMFFPFAQDISEKRDIFETTYAFIELTKSADGSYMGSGKLMYPFEGPQPLFKIMSYDQLTENRDGNTAYVSGLTLDTSIDEHNFLILEPSSTTTILRTNVIVVALTFILIVIGLAETKRRYI